MTHKSKIALSQLLLISMIIQFQGAIALGQLVADKIPPDRKAIHLQGYLGPFGEPYIPPEILASKEFKAAAESAKDVDSDAFFFPSIYFVISAKPNIHIKSKNPSGSGFINYEFAGVAQDLSWMRVSMKLEPVPCTEGMGEEAKKDPMPIRVLALLPETTEEHVEESKPVQIVDALTQTTTKLLPFMPSIKEGADTVAGATNVLFKNIFPPRSVATSYAYLDNDREFGWFWKRIDLKDKPESLVGVRRGLALMQIKRGVSGLRVTYRIEAKWNSDVSDLVDDEYADADSVPYGGFTGTTTETFKFDKSFCSKPPKKNFYQRTDYQFLKDLEEFPIVIPKEIVCKILQKGEVECANWDISKDYPTVKVIVSDGKQYVLRADLKKMLSL